MVQTSDFVEPGLLLVSSQPNSPLSSTEFNNWHNSEHGPARTRLDLSNGGYFYRCKDDSSITGLYDLNRVVETAESQYANLWKRRPLREQRLPRSKDDTPNSKVYKHISTRGSGAGPAPVMTCVSFVVRSKDVHEVHRWYEEEHIKDLSLIPGWRRSRRFEIVDGDVLPGCVELLALHEFDRKNGLGGPEHMRARYRPWREKIVQLALSRSNRELEFSHTGRVLDEQLRHTEQLFGEMSRRTGVSAERRPSLVSFEQEYRQMVRPEISLSQTLVPQVH